MTTFKKLILDDLKAAKLNNIVAKITSIRYRSFAGGDAVDVEATDLNKEERKALEDLLEDYQDGHFDGMTDMYNYKKGEAKKVRTAKYVHLRNDFSQATKDAAIEELKTQWEITDNDTAQAKMNTWYDTAIHRICSAK